MKTKLFIFTLAFACCLCFTLAETADQAIKMGSKPNRTLSSTDQQVIEEYNQVAHALNSKTRLEKAHAHGSSVQQRNKKFVTEMRDLKKLEER